MMSPRHRCASSSVPEPASSCSTVSTREEAANLARFVLPSLATTLAAPILSLTDTAFVGRAAASASSSASASAVGLAALSQATILVDYSPLLSSFVAIAALNLSATAFARGDDGEARTIASTSMMMAVALSLVLTLVITFLPTQILRAQGVAETVLPNAVAYCRGRALGTPFAAVTAAAAATLAARRNMMPGLRGVMAAGLVNVLGDWILVSRLGMGAEGAAWATSMAQVVGCLVVITAMVQKGLLRGGRWDGKIARDVTSFAGPVIFVTFSVLSIFSALILLSNKLGILVSAAHRILGGLFSVGSLFGDPLMQAAQAFLPVYLLNERGDKDALGFITILMGLGIGFGLLLGTTCCTVAYLFPSIFTANSAIAAEMHRVLPAFFLASTLVIPSKVLYGTAIAAKQLNFLMGLVVGGTLGFMIQLAFMLRAGLTYKVLWLVLANYYAFGIVALSLRLFGVPGTAFHGVLNDEKIGNVK